MSEEIENEGYTKEPLTYANYLHIAWEIAYLERSIIVGTIPCDTFDQRLVEIKNKVLERDNDDDEGYRDKLINRIDDVSRVKYEI